MIISVKRSLQVFPLSWVLSFNTKQSLTTVFSASTKRSEPTEANKYDPDHYESHSAQCIKHCSISHIYPVAHSVFEHILYRVLISMISVFTKSDFVGHFHFLEWVLWCHTIQCVFVNWQNRNIFSYTYNISTQTSVFKTVLHRHHLLCQILIYILLILPLLLIHVC